MITFAVAYLGLLVITGTEAVTQVSVSSAKAASILGSSAGAFADGFREAADSNAVLARTRLEGGLPRAITLMKGGPSPGGFCNEPEPETFFYVQEWQCKAGWRFLF